MAEDFKSYAELGIPVRDPDNEGVLWQAQGISMFDTEEGARKKARRIRSLGGYIAMIEFPAGDFQHERTGGRGHYTIWARSEDLLVKVVAVTPVETVR